MKQGPEESSRRVQWNLDSGAASCSQRRRFLRARWREMGGFSKDWSCSMRCFICG
jgi:hypothetical protein